MNRSRVLTCLAVILMLFSTCSNASPGLASQTASGLRLRLEFIPFTTPQARLVMLDQHTVHVIRFDTDGRHVASAGSRKLDAAEQARLERLLSILNKRWFSASYAGDGLTGGDQFRLWLALDSSITGETWGFVGNASPGLQALIGAVDAFASPASRLVAMPVSTFYLRARVVAPDRLDDLIRTTPIRIIGPGSLPASLQKLAGDAVADPLSFHPFPAGERKRFLDQRSLGNDVYLRFGGTVFELQLYSGK